MQLIQSRRPRDVGRPRSFGAVRSWRGQPSSLVEQYSVRRARTMTDDARLSEILVILPIIPRPR
jgi:hypothetical protein